MDYTSTQTVQALWVAESNWTPGSGIKLHAHDSYYHLFVVREGPLEMTAGGETRMLNQGMAMLAPPGVFHALQNISGGIMSVYEIKFTVSSPAVARQLEALPFFLPGNELAALLTLELVEEGARQELSSHTRVSHYLTALLDCFCRHFGRQEEPDTAVIDTAGYSETSKRIVRYLEENFTREIPLQEIADLVGFNKNYICSLFKQDSGMTIGGCHTVIRIRKAAEMISFSDMDLSQVAQTAGFTSTSHFTRVFKKVVGIPPGQYRRMFPTSIINRAQMSDIDALIEKNGFIAAMVSRKKMSIRDIIEGSMDEDEN